MERGYRFDLRWLDAVALGLFFTKYPEEAAKKRFNGRSYARLRRYIPFGIDLNAADGRGETLLVSMMKHGAGDIERLLADGADPDRTSWYRTGYATPLEIAIARRERDVAALLARVTKTERSAEGHLFEDMPNCVKYMREIVGPILVAKRLAAMNEKLPPFLRL